MTGLWHGASWNFVVWGLYHGLFLMAERAGLGKRIERLPRALTHLYTLLVVMIGWVFFRADNLVAAVLYLKKMLGFSSISSTVTLPVDHFIDKELITTLLFGLLFVVPTYKRFHEQISKLQDKLKSYSFQILFDTSYAFGLFVLFIGTIMYLAADTYNPFIYFRF
jgi:alginate O-acetyltransferase complex protein AlgI